MFRILQFFTVIAIAGSFLLALLNHAYWAETAIVSGTIAYGVLTIFTLFKANFKMRAPYISEVVLGGLLIVLIRDGYTYAGAKPILYYLFITCFILRTVSIKNEEQLAG